jgi:hypothetical protein
MNKITTLVVLLFITSLGSANDPIGKSKKEHPQQEQTDEKPIKTKETKHTEKDNSDKLKKIKTPEAPSNTVDKLIQSGADMPHFQGR